MTFWKTVYQRYTNFAMESIRDDLGVDVEFATGTRLVRYSIPRYGDLVNAVYLGLQLPEVKSGGRPHPFRWVRNLGEALVEEVSMYIGGALIERLYGEWLHVWNELTMGHDARGWYDEMVANTPAFHGGADGARPARTVFVPIPFSFTRNSALALPLVALQYHTVDLEFRLRPTSELFQLHYTPSPSQPEGWHRPDATRADHHVGAYLVRPDHRFRVFIEMNYVFLDDAERARMARDSHEYLIQQVGRTQFEGLVAPHNVLDLVLQNPVAQLVWVPAVPAESRARNDHFAFGGREGDDDNAPLRTPIRACSLLFNGMPRFAEREAEYFRFVQPFQHGATGAGRNNNVFMYSFALGSGRGETQPSGSCNMSRVNSVQLGVRLDPGTVGAGVTVYSVNYNVFKMVAGMASIVFAN
jgi:hypothetical protein